MISLADLRGDTILQLKKKEMNPLIRVGRNQIDLRSDQLLVCKMKTKYNTLIWEDFGGS